MGEVSGLNIGDPVTVVLHTNNPHRTTLVHTKVSSIWPVRGAIVLVVSELTDGRYLHNEGISWCRGHDGPAVEALKVALALS